ncbi:MAG: J domain-containing protein [Treponema sp.]|jgi:DnaJ-domain-containing protein 1|nr:J domain-containing protein [Treponema sp.]
MGIVDRIGNVIKSYLNSGDEGIPDGRGRSGDPDLDAAFAELDDYLDRRKGGREGAGKGGAEERRERDRGGGGAAEGPPEPLRADFAELGLPFGASAGECREAYKKLLNIHHPDRHARHPENFNKASGKTARINAAYDRIEEWRKGKA